MEKGKENGVTNKLLSEIINQMKEHNELLNNIQSQLKTYRRPDIFGQLAAFSTSAAAVYQIKRLADEVERCAGFLKGIEQNLSSHHIRGEHFPQHVHSYVRLLIEKHASDAVPHYFTVFNNSDLWHPKFADIQRGDPFGPSYLGHKTDLDELCAFLAEEVRPRVEQSAVLHILMPTVGPLSLEEAVKFPEAMRPFKIDGQIGDGGTKFVYICTPEAQDQEYLSGVGVLRQREIWKMQGGIGIPLTPLQTSFHQYFVDPKYKVGTEVGLLLAGGIYYCLGLEPPRTLGQPTARPWS
ncbi:uncharacterized protein T069G_11091 [Trichoderma breve]|uniref:Uncharacterized protein n=1 Tax=Trichoderma breve TaxID=2034170 RepID=A0A9W9B3S8_9HYPO|nr:uncharacterized protein T069G_11091 [Trichoderma breve]KAJ4855533.1 hypothetical protein T069G_11091 [Trichoderma breve]